MRIAEQETREAVLRDETAALENALDPMASQKEAAVESHAAMLVSSVESSAREEAIEVSVLLENGGARSAGLRAAQLRMALEEGEGLVIRGACG